MISCTLKFVAGVLPALVGGGLAIIGITNIAISLVPSASPLWPPNYGRSVLLILWLLAALTGGVACIVAWVKELKRNSEPNKWLIAGLAVWILACTPIAVIGLLEILQTRYANWLDQAFVAGCFSSIAVAALLLTREIQLTRIRP